MATKKVDNHDPRAKLDLRRYMLNRYHADGQPIRVMDCCQGSGLLWKTLRKEFQIASYFGIDVKRKPGRMKIESQRVLTQPGWRENVVDVDTYGSCWKHWEAMLPNVARPTTVFLTLGAPKTPTMGMGMQLTGDELRAMGLIFPTLKLPGAFPHALRHMALAHSLARAGSFGLIIREAVEAVSDGNARYLGIRLEKPA